MGQSRSRLNRVVRVETASGAEWTDGRMRVRPVATTTVVGGGVGGRFLTPLDSGRGLFSRTRASAVEVSFDGRSYLSPILDVTRLGQVVIVLIALLVLTEVWARTRMRKERS